MLKNYLGAILFAVISFFPFVAGAQTYWQANGNNIYNTNSGYVGIGTTSPGYLLDVSKAIGIPEIALRSGNSYVSQHFTGGQYGDVDWQLLGGYPSAGDFTIRQTGVLNAITIKKITGNIGIGTTTPSSKFTVKDAQTSTPSLNHDDPASINFSISGGELVIGSYPLPPYSTWFQVRNDTVNNVSYPLSFNPSGGNVGVGTITPAAKLDVAGNNGNDKWSALSLSNTYNPTTNDVSSVSELVFKMNQWNGSAYVSATSSKITAGKDNDFTYSNLTKNDGYLSFSSVLDGTATERLRIASGGNVGIGTTSPQEKLEVNGNIKVFGNIVSDGDICIGVCQ